MSPSEKADLDEVTVVLEKMRFALTRQRRAVASLDVAELAEATAEQRHLVDELAVARRLIDAVETTVHAEIRRLASDVRNFARANAALLSDARSMIGQVLGTETVAVGYDRRACRESEPRRSIAKAV